MDYPKLRSVEIFLTTIEGRQCIAIKDPLGLMEGFLLLPSDAAPLLSLMDGKHSVREMQVEYVRRFGKLIMSDEIQRLISRLDEHFLLDNERYRTELQRLKQWFSKQLIRKQAHSGTSYPEDAEQLRAFLDSFYSHPKGPGIPRPDSSATVPNSIVAPHIDLRRGGHCYAWAYYRLASAMLANPQPIMFVVLGIAHCEMEQPFAITCKGFETPLGVAKADTEFIRQLTELCPSIDLFADELAHQYEHSIEFQVLFLQHAFEGLIPFTLVPILCGSQYILPEIESPFSIEPVREFVHALQHAIKGWHQRTCIIASVDLSHFGARFGHSAVITPQLLQWLRQYDGEFLSYVEQGDAEGMFQFVMRNRNFTNIDAVPAIYAMLKTLTTAKGRTLKYEQSPDPDGRSVVTFCAAELYVA